MAVRRLGGARLRRAARGRAGFAGLAAALYLGAGILATAPAVFEPDRFLGYGIPRAGVVTPGDHLQTVWQLWLPGHQLARGEAPWLDPYSFQPLVEPRVNFAGWPFALVFGPLEALLGTVAGWNAFVLLTYVGAGGAAALWLRGLGLSRGAAVVGGLAFALAPYRVAQSTGHLLGPVSMLLPLALYGVERRRWLAVLALASIPLSGQVHLALGAIPFVLAYALARRRALTGALATGTAVAAGALVWALTLRDAGERPYAEVERYSATLLDFVRRDPGEFERFVYLGWLLPLAALVGLTLCFRNTSSFGRRLGLVLGLGALVPILLALGSNLPGYGVLWRNTPLEATRVPERMLPIASLCLAALAAHALACVPGTQSLVRVRALAAVAAALVVADLWVPLYDPLVADPGNPVYAQVAHAPPGRLLETPVLPPDAYAGSVYLYYAMQAPRERPLGYATSAPPEAFERPDPEELGVSVVVQYRDGVPARLTSP